MFNIKEEVLKLNQWTYLEEEQCLVKSFTFKSYLKNISFVNAIAWQANRLNHHPDLEIKFNICIVRITTHDLSKLTDKDIELAQAIDQLN